jgi:HAD superfamily hydrolase (TIGR01509 family)
MRHLKVRAILFDMDGTLIDSTEASEITWQRWAVAHRVSMESIRRVHHGRRPEETIAIVAPYLNAIEESKHIYAGQEMLAEGIKPIAGANSFFESIPSGQCAIVTAASRAIVDLRFRTVGLVPPDVCVTGDTLKVGKPSPEGYLEAARRLECRPEDCIVFEDAPAGLIAAHRAGMQSVAVLSNYTEPCLREELNPEMVPWAFLQDFRGVTYLDGILRLPE